MTDGNGDCCTPRSTSLKTLHSGLSPSTSVIAPSVEDEGLNGLASEASPVLILHDEPKRPRIKLRLRPTYAGPSCSAIDRPESVLSTTTNTALPRVRITLKTGSVKKRMALDRDAEYKKGEGRCQKKRRILLRTR